MIISNIIGGLGNQMFQYAFGRARALALGVPLTLDLADFAGYSLHQGFELGRAFAGEFVAASASDVQRMLGWRRYTICRRILSKPFAAELRGPHLVVEPHFGYWPGSAQTVDDSYFLGYWQSEKYFSKFAPEIRADFTFKGRLAGDNREVAARIEDSAAVSLHVRRGDYAANPRTRAVHGLCSPDYYAAAVDWMNARVTAPEYFVFSDDIAWAAANLGLRGTFHFVGHNKGQASHADMHLMSMCRHHIIANSSFSWWGAWLNPEPEKVVIAPRCWFATGAEVPDLCPEGWILL
jgi:hypothetical protein